MAVEVGRNPGVTDQAQNHVEGVELANIETCRKLLSTPKIAIEPKFKSYWGRICLILTPVGV
jgi:hypothetical protein